MGTTGNNGTTLYYKGTSDIRASVSDTNISGATCEYTTGNNIWAPALYSGAGYCYVTGLSYTSDITINFRVDDIAGNVTTGTATTYIYDGTAPTTTINNTNTNRINTGIFVTLTASDTGVGVSGTYYSILSGNVSCAGPYTQYTSSVTVTGVIDNAVTRTFCWWSIDDLGNTETINKQVYNIDLANPTIGAPYIYSGNYYNQFFKGIIGVRSSLSDTGAGIMLNSCQFSTG